MGRSSNAEKIELKKSKIMKKARLENREEILNGPIAKTLFKLAWPVMIGNTMQVAYNLADTFWLGRVGADAVAALSVGFPLVFLMVSIGAGITVAGTTLVAQYMGMGNEEKVNKITAQIFVFVGSLSIILGLIGFLFNEPVLNLMGAPENIIGDASAYLEIISLGVPFMFAFFIFSALLRGYGDTKTPMKMMVFFYFIKYYIRSIFDFWYSFFSRIRSQRSCFCHYIFQGNCRYNWNLYFIYR